MNLEGKLLLQVTLPLYYQDNCSIYATLKCHEIDNSNISRNIRKYLGFNIFPVLVETVLIIKIYSY